MQFKPYTEKIATLMGITTEDIDAIRAKLAKPLPHSFDPDMLGGRCRRCGASSSDALSEGCLTAAGITIDRDLLRALLDIAEQHSNTQTEGDACAGASSVVDTVIDVLVAGKLVPDDALIYPGSGCWQVSVHGCGIRTVPTYSEALRAAWRAVLEMS